MCLENKNAVDGVMSNDGDCVMLGAKNFCFNVNFNSETFQMCDKGVDCAKVDDNPLFS